MKKTILMLFALVTSVALMAQPPAGDANVGDHYGAKVSEFCIPIGAKILNDALKRGEEGLIGDNIAIEGKVVEVCAKKGCFTKIELSDKSVVTIKMKDYGFFVPLKLVGKKIRAEGKAEVGTTSVAELKHLAEDAGKSQKEIDAIKEPKKEIKFLATGIQVIK